MRSKRIVAGSIAALSLVAIGQGVYARLAPAAIEEQKVDMAAAQFWMKRARVAEARADRLADSLAKKRAEEKVHHRSVKLTSIAAIRQVFGSEAERAIRVARCETGGTLSPTAANPADRHSDGSLGSWGLFQIGSVHRKPGESIQAFKVRMFDPVQNAQMAFRISDGGRSFASAWRTCGAGL